MRVMLLSLGLALAYAGLGVLALQLAIPAGYATAIFPSAGLALAAVLIWGWRAVPAVGFGSLLLNLWTGYTLGSDVSPTAIPLALGISLGAMAQAWAGARLVHWKVSSILHLERPLDSLWLLVLGGPVACVVAASIGSVCLLQFGVITSTQWFQTWWTWWIGDSIGVLIVAPLVIMFQPNVHPAWRYRRLPVIVALAVTLSLLALSVTQMSQRESQRAAEDFARRSDVVAQALTERLYGYEEYVNAVSRYLSVTPQPEAAAFRNFVKDLYSRYPGIRALSWLPAVRAEQRDAFEQHQRLRLQSSFAIRELGTDGQLRRAGARELYFPVLFIEPRRGNEAAIGLDISFESRRRAAIEQALQAGKMQATASIHLVQEQSDQAGILMAQPVYADDGQLRGLVTGIFSLSQWVEPAVRRAEELGVAAEVRDLSAASEVLMPRTLPVVVDAPPTLFHRSVIEWGGHRYQLDSRPAAAFVAGINSWGIWLLMASGLLLASLVEAFLIALPIGATAANKPALRATGR